MTPKVIFIAFAALMATLAAGCDREGPDAAREGNEAFASERYGDAREAYDRALKTIPDRPELDYNSGNTLYREQRFAEAGTRYDDAFPDAEPPACQGHRLQLGQRAVGSWQSRRGD